MAALYTAVVLCVFTLSAGDELSGADAAGMKKHYLRVKTAGEAAGRAAVDDELSPLEAGEAAADAALAAGGSTLDAAKAAAATAGYAAEFLEESGKEVGRATADAVFAVAGSTVDVVKLSHDAALAAARDDGKSPKEAGMTAGQAVIAAAQALARKNRLRGRPIAEGGARGPAVVVVRKDSPAPVVMRKDSTVERGTYPPAPVVMRKDATRATSEAAGDAALGLDALPAVDRYMFKVMAAVTVLISLAIAASTILVRTSRGMSSYCGLRTPLKSVGVMGTIQKQLENLTTTDDASCQGSDDFDKTV